MSYSSVFSRSCVVIIAAMSAAAPIASTVVIGAEPLPKPREQQAPAPSIPVIPPGNAYRVFHLVSDWPGLAPIQDPLLVNPWGIAESASSPFWVANNVTSTSTLFRGDVGGSPLIKNPGPSFITIPGDEPTGTVFNPFDDFMVTPPMGVPAKAIFIFASITGNITAWQPALGNSAQIVASHAGRVYTGLAIGTNADGNRLYAADFANGNIDVYDGDYALTTVSGGFVDPTIPNTMGNTYHPFNIQAIGSALYVMYAKFDPMTGEEEVGVGNGFVRRFNTDGVRDLTFGIDNGPTSPLNAPWGATIAPASFGVFGGNLLIGNFGEGGASINAFSPTTGASLGPLQDESGEDIEIDELWAIQFGNGGNGGDANTLYFTAGPAEEEHGLFGKLNPTTASATSLIQLADSEFSVGEGTGHIDVTVTRSGDVSGTATVNYATFDESEAGHASQISDYELAVGMLTFAPGETSKTFRILIVNDQFMEGDETLEIILSNVTGDGVGLGSPATAEVTILDDDAVPPTSNPIDDPSFFVRQLFLDFLGREPEPATFNFFVTRLSTCGSDNTCRDTRRADIATAFFLSAEFHQTGYLIYLANKAAFGDFASGPQVPLLYGQLLRDLQIINQDVSFGTPGWEAQLAANQMLFFADFVLRPTFVGTYPTTMTPAEFVDALYANANVVPSALERQAAIDEFGGASDTSDTAARARALKRVTQNGTFNTNEFNRAFVFFEFAAFYRRDPDMAAFNMHVATLDSFNGDFRAAGLINTFLSSSEYRERFGLANPPAPGVGPTPSPGAQSLNISTRGRVGTGDNVLIAGFIITGTGSKNVVLRAIGPSLTSSGISDGLEDPVLELRAADGSLIESNDDWMSNQAEVEATGLAPTDPRESAIVRTLATGTYTAIVRGKGSATGVALAEVYDIDTQPSSSQLANISTRGLVQTQNNVLIGGFQLGGNSGSPLIVARAIGPSLADFGILSPLADPTIEFHDSNGATLSTNDNWRDTQELEILYLILAPTRDAESALVIQPVPGPYTAIVAGKDGGTGIGLVEIFNFR
jgi:uncharacterized protein (TIGR03118 family)